MSMRDFPYNVPGYHAPDVTILRFFMEFGLLLAVVGGVIAVVYYVATSTGAPV